MMRMMILFVVLAAWLPAQKLHEICAPCHNQHVEDFSTHKHASKGLSCDACHGKSSDHSDAGGNRPPDKVMGPAEQPAGCGACHPAARKEYEASKHAQRVAARSRAAACTTCHGTHAARPVTAMAARCQQCHKELPAACGGAPKSEAAVRCAGCHSPHSLAKLP